MQQCGTCQYWRRLENSWGCCDAPLPTWVRVEYDKESWEYRTIYDDKGSECETYRSQ